MKKSKLIESLIADQFKKNHQSLDCKIIVNTQDEHHFDVIVISNAFLDKKPLERQRLVYNAIGSNITSGEIHALALKTYTQDEYNNKK